MKQAEQLPRNALIWILLSQFALLLPHLPRLPLWLPGLYLACTGWRFMVHRGRWEGPGRVQRLAMVLVAAGGIAWSYGTLLGLEPMVALLLAASALKVTELWRRQDAYVLVFLGYFICITGFLFSQGILLVLYSLLPVLLLSAALVALHQPHRDRFHIDSLRTASVMLAQALPLMLVLFFLFPRIGPLWAIPLKTQTAKTGVSDFMRPGDISRLSRSDEVAFRVSFDGDIPASSRLYWRGLVFSKLEAGTWSALRYFEVPPNERRPEPLAPEGEPVRYSIIMAPTQQNWLYSLRYAESPQRSVVQSSDYRLFRPVEIEDQFRYEARSWLQAPIELTLSAWRRQVELALPADSNPRTRELALTMRARASSDSAYLDDVLDMFREQDFHYTLEPPLLGGQPMDEFLFESRRGFCEHYAYAFTVMMRAAGVPARVVAGYQGGEVNPLNRTVIVHQFDAHAWSEVWLPGEGWRRVDPTAAVSPDRIERGLEEAVAAEGSFLADSPLSPLRYRGVPWLNTVRLRLDAMTYQWQSWIVGFDGQVQLDLLQNWFGRLNAGKFVLLLLGGFALVLVPVAFQLLRRPRVRPSALDRAYGLFCQRLAGAGVERRPGETPEHYALRASSALPDWESSIYKITRCYVEARYAPQGRSEAEAASYVRSVLVTLPGRASRWRMKSAS